MPDELEGLPPSVRALLEEAIRRMRVEQTDPVLAAIAEGRTDVRMLAARVEGLVEGVHAVDRRVTALEEWRRGQDGTSAALAARLDAIATEARERTDEVDRRVHSTLDGLRVEIRHDVEGLAAQLDTVTRARAQAAVEWAKVCRLVTENWKAMLAALVVVLLGLAIVWRVPVHYTDGEHTLSVGEAAEQNEARAPTE